MSFSELEESCSLCGETNKFFILSTPELEINEPENLDTRPGGYLKFKFNAKVTRCAKCGYCAENIEERILFMDEPWEELPKIVNSKKYKKQLQSTLYPTKSNEFLCKSYLLEKSYRTYDAAIASLHAAWNCDDENKEIQAKICRKRAIKLFTLDRLTYGSRDKYVEKFPLLLIDLYRRTEQFKKAKKICDVCIEDNSFDGDLFYFQKFLCEKEDIKSHNVNEASDYYDENILYHEPDDEFIEFRETYRKESNWEQDYFNAMTDGQLGDFNDFKGDVDDVENWSRG